MLAPQSLQAGDDSRIRPVPKKLQEQIALCASHPQKVLFLDVETTGLSHFYDEITLVGWSFDGRASTLVRGQDHEQLRSDLQNALALVTFNGIRFDQRFLKKEFPDLEIPSIHLDLMYLCRRVGLTGGQKAIEKELELSLRGGISDVDGFVAVLLWHRYLRGEKAALETLVAYNRADIAAMGALLDEAVSRLELPSDLFAKRTSFLSWSAPEGWTSVPKLPAPDRANQPKPYRFADLFEDSPAARAKVVGIDLTGSEERGSGWCLLDGHQALTRVVFTDDELLERTIATGPDLVSIDSPLCLPIGRVSVEDSDPGRERFGIMRQCERELKRRGINVYPCLLPSMQKLTARGIRLAATLREKGIPVIESYPGAAQDIMRIPRKGAGIEWLEVGLAEFGIEGSLTGTTHDELDAVTSALVGTFHLAGLSEQLGNDEEPPLVIPDLMAKPLPIVIGVSGPIAAGKTTLAEALENKGFAYTRFSLVLDDLLTERGIEANRTSRQRLGAELNTHGKQRWLAAQTLARVEGAHRIVVDGLRFPDDHAYLKERFGLQFHHVFVDASEDVRRARFEARGKDGTFQEAAASKVESKVDELKELADEMLVNDRGIGDVVKFAEAISERMGADNCQSQS